MNNILHMQHPMSSSTDICVPSLLREDETPCELINGAGAANMVIACEHASNYIPKYFDGLGLSEKATTSHAAFDPGAKALAIALSQTFDAPLVCSKISRLVYDCNRPQGASSAMPVRSEIYDVPGNANVSEGEIQARYEQIYVPFEQMLGASLTAKTMPILITVHTFTPVFHGEKRAVEIGILHDEDARLADAMLDASGQVLGFRIERNQPYGPTDGVAHTIDVHGADHGLLNVMIEVRNDLLVDANDVERAANALGQMIKIALTKLGVSMEGNHA